ncbi:hypothetical protein EJ05DRAFT_501008 [Pseudovirgaria hyperparasitica]|uniref:Vacuolar ATPase assembly protein VMA22 n=1 Tax=Pseudovirgaria hyperparasitica TaxID=470096 RepID=A0A6A6W4C8_9PEZI|nr:uncharacterized protein EJ05DRAFT_501008 [Pseudovirgaria hyperparasitica]KAF2757473.1 hypothetical protein EJ05DRAFT_501008 [Pseudovirgaria hyperparasitica]
MASVLAPMADQNLQQKPSREEMLDKIDHLLERYLELVDEYQKTRIQLSSHMSSGFISLAQSNFASRVRYGQDQYDDRMKAWRRARISQTDSGLTKLDLLSLNLTPTTNTSESADQASSDEKVHPDNDQQPRHTKDDGQTINTENGQHGRSPEKSPNRPSDESEEKIVDPIRWFGVLVPQALRTSQSHFVQAVDDPIPKLCNILREMRILESEIGRTRKQAKKLS